MTTIKEDFAVADLRCEGLINPVGIDDADPRLSWCIESERRGARQSAFQILVATNMRLLTEGKADLWDSGKIESWHSMHVLYGGKPLKSRMSCFWKVRIWDQSGRASEWSPLSVWSMGLLITDDWSAKWIGQPENTGDMTSPWFRKTFILPSTPVKAMVFVNVLGYFEFFVNGRKVGDDVLSPHVSDISKRLYYITYNITDFLRKGENCVALWLGRGWYRRGFLWPVAHGGPIVRIELNLMYSDGTTRNIVTDEAWKVRPSCMALLGEWRWNEFGGECYDATAEVPGWNLTALDNTVWADAVLVQQPEVPARVQMLPPNRITETFGPANIEPFGNDSYLVDMGKAITGWFEIRLPAGERGRKIVMEFGDSLNGQELNSFNQRSEYVYRGDGEETFRNRFNYASFQYVKLTNLPGKPDKKDITGHFITTDLQQAGWFSCSNKILNAIHDTMRHTLSCLMLGGYQVDCHSRERLGYGGDGQSSLETTLTMFRADAFYRKWTADWIDAQHPDGGMPHTAPCPYKAGGGPFWCGFLTAATWRHYLHYGDVNLLQRNYPAMVKWLQYVEKYSQGGLLHQWPDTDYRTWYLGDWATPAGIDQKHSASVDLFCNCYVIYALELTARIAKALSNDQDARRWEKEADHRRPLVHETFFNPEIHTYADGDQIDLIMPLLAEVVPGALRDTVFRQFEYKLLVKRAGHLTTGLSGTYMMIQYLQEIGRDDLIYIFATKEDEPSWGAMLARGATAIWEHWNGDASRIHNCYNSIGSWFQQGLAGIQPDPGGPGFERAIIRPAIVGDLTFVEARYDSVRGPIESAWQVLGDRVHLDVSIPAGMSATVQLPATSADVITVDGSTLSDAEGIELLGYSNGRINIETVSGRYMFSIPLPANAGPGTMEYDRRDRTQ